MLKDKKNLQNPLRKCFMCTHIFDLIWLDDVFVLEYFNEVNLWFKEYFATKQRKSFEEKQLKILFKIMLEKYCDIQLQKAFHKYLPTTWKMKSAHRGKSVLRNRKNNTKLFLHSRGWKTSLIKISLAIAKAEFAF